jgi:hypothetical protein
METQIKDSLTALLIAIKAHDGQTVADEMRKCPNPVVNAAGDRR